MTLTAHLESLGACEEARQWARGKTAAEAWQTCERPDWLFWWAGRTPCNTHMDIVRAACGCARSVLQFVPSGEDRPLKAIEAAERWAIEPTAENKVASRAAAYAADAADAAACAADAAYAAYAADAAACAACAAAAANAADAADAAADAKQQKRHECCDIIRATLCIPWTESE